MADYDYDEGYDIGYMAGFMDGANIRKELESMIAEKRREEQKSEFDIMMGLIKNAVGEDCSAGH